MVKKCGILLQIYDTNMRTQTVNDHFQQETSMHQEAVRANSRKKSSYFDREEQRKINTVKDEVYYKVFTSLYWLAKEDMPSSKINSLLIQLENFETRTETVLRKMLLLIDKS